MKSGRVGIGSLALVKPAFEADPANDCAPAEPGQLGGPSPRAMIFSRCRFDTPMIAAAAESYDPSLSVLMAPIVVHASCCSSQFRRANRREHYTNHIAWSRTASQGGQ